jgi:SAM-dependent methyltransferase
MAARPEPRLIDSYEDDCSVCGRRGTFIRREGEPVRESYRCPDCRSSARYRVQAACLCELYKPGARSMTELVSGGALRDLRVYEPGVGGPFRERLRGACAVYEQSFLWPDTPPGERKDGVRCENLERLTFADGSFDLVVTSDIFEHVRDPVAAFGEVGRVLAPGGRHLFTVPALDPWPRSTVRRVDVSGEQEDVHLLPPSHHGDGRGGRCLVYNDFGADLLDALAGLGLPTRVFRRACPNPQVGRVIVFESRKPEPH